MKRSVVLVIKRDGLFSSLLRQNGCRVWNLELIKTTPVNDLSELEAHLRRLEDYDGLFITSPAAAKVFVRQLKAIRGNFSGRVYALGARARNLLEGAGLNVIVGRSANTAGDLIRSFEDGEFAGGNFLFIRGDQSMRTIPELLKSAARIDEIAVYRTVEIEPDENDLKLFRSSLESGDVAWTCFFSPSGVRAFVKLFGSAAETAAAVIGETTEGAARQSGLNVSYVSPEASAAAFATGLLEKIQNH